MLIFAGVLQVFMKISVKPTYACVSIYAVLVILQVTKIAMYIL